MPTLLNLKGFKFFFYANEHEPKHVHVMKGEGFAKIELHTMRVVQNCLKPKELKTALSLTKEHQKEFERTWDEWFN
ncbi:MAG: DUF4160 domain-containing protein [Thiovulaceae bacterium]|nr:DUF4160 domain-containing protein [Sulfurimonadaceae bacterium]